MNTFILSFLYQKTKYMSLIMHPSSGNEESPVQIRSDETMILASCFNIEVLSCHSGKKITVFIREDSRERSFSVEKTNPKFHCLYSEIQILIVIMNLRKQYIHWEPF